ncbi:hypothetical protein EVAR_91212_1 [Eumeta japonica]|uniref:Uncharacterized protein n=1 Tax=Eumeta variegata TaxID=151549 RepID=A0A4C2AGP9_EUMVA|nr:hypothetical protein EVAR_91212_1 [Eumeta japonica]
MRLSRESTRQKVAHEVFGSRTPAIKMMLMVFPASGAMMEISGRNEVKEFFRVCPAVHAIEHAQRATSVCKANRIYSCVSLHPAGLLLEPESIPVSELTSQGLLLEPESIPVVSLHPAGLLLEPESIPVRLLLERAESIPVSELTSCRAPPEPESIPVSEFTSCRAPLRARIYSCEVSLHPAGLILESESIPVSEFTSCRLILDFRDADLKPPPGRAGRRLAVAVCSSTTRTSEIDR